MSFAEMKEKALMLTKEERLELSHLLLDLELQESPEYVEELNQRMAEMDAGKRVTLEQLEKAHRDLLAQGR